VLSPLVPATFVEAVRRLKKLGRVRDPGLLAALASEHADGAPLSGIENRADQPELFGTTGTAARRVALRNGQFICAEVNHRYPDPERASSASGKPLPLIGMAQGLLVRTLRA
jgi:hypothetical protein